MKRIIIVHGWGGTPEVDWYKWAQKAFQERGYDSKLPAMPNTMHPTIDEWISKLKEVVGEPNKETYLIGHSIGCQTIMRYLEGLEEGKQVGGIILVSGWFGLTDETWDEEYTQEIADPWMNTPLDTEEIKKHVGRVTFIYSNDDPYIPKEDPGMFKERLGAKIIEFEGKGHLSGEEGITEFPELLDEFEQISK